MKEAIIKETPARVLSLLGCSLFSLALLFAVSLSNASFGGSERPLPDPFAPNKAVAVIDNTAAAYSRFLSANFLNPLKAQYSLYGDNLAWLGQQAHVAYFFGLEGYNFHSPPSNLVSPERQGQVAGAFISVQQSANPSQQDFFGLGQGSTIDNFFSILIR